MPIITCVCLMVCVSTSCPHPPSQNTLTHARTSHVLGHDCSFEGSQAVVINVWMWQAANFTPRSVIKQIHFMASMCLCRTDTSGHNCKCDSWANLLSTLYNSPQTLAHSPTLVVTAGVRVAQKKKQKSFKLHHICWGKNKSSFRFTVQTCEWCRSIRKKANKRFLLGSHVPTPVATKRSLVSVGITKLHQEMQWNHSLFSNPRVKAAHIFLFLHSYAGFQSTHSAVLVGTRGSHIIAINWPRCECLWRLRFIRRVGQEGWGGRS